MSRGIFLLVLFCGERNGVLCPPKVAMFNASLQRFERWQQPRGDQSMDVAIGDCWV